MDKRALSAASNPSRRSVTSCFNINSEQAMDFIRRPLNLEGRWCGRIRRKIVKRWEFYRRYVRLRQKVNHCSWTRFRGILGFYSSNAHVGDY